jgi:hypothetical protein
LIEVLRFIVNRSDPCATAPQRLEQRPPQFRQLVITILPPRSAIQRPSVPTSPASPVFDTTNAATPNPDDLAADILHGAQAIADYIGVDLRRAFYLLQHGYIPAVKTGATWTSTKSRLRRHFNGEQ